MSGDIIFLQELDSRRYYFPFEIIFWTIIFPYSGSGEVAGTALTSGMDTYGRQD